MKNLKTTFNELLPIALQSHISVLDFWDMTLLEIVQSINAYRTNQKEQLKVQAGLDYQQAQLISCFVGSLFSKEDKLPSIYEAYPNLFNDELSDIDRQKQEKEKLRAFVIAHNKVVN